MAEQLPAIAERYERDGVVVADILDDVETVAHRRALDIGEAALGPLHYMNKVHTVMRSPYDLATHPRVLDIVEALIGHDILLYNVDYIIKEPGSDAFVSWHQDLTYWGLADDDAQVSMWLALEPATAESGCMSMVPGSHRGGRVVHVEQPSDANVLLLGQQIVGVDPATARHYPLAAGQASFHHGWTVHESGPNRARHRRVGLNVQYLAPHNRQERDDAATMLVRGVDNFGHFRTEQPPDVDFEPDAVARFRELDQAMKQSFKTKR